MTDDAKDLAEKMAQGCETPQSQTEEKDDRPDRLSQREVEKRRQQPQGTEVKKG